MCSSTQSYILMERNGQFVMRGCDSYIYLYRLMDSFVCLYKVIFTYGQLHVVVYS